MQCNELHALMIRANTIAQNCWPALGHRLNRIMVALGHNHNHSGMQDYSCSVIKCTTARCHKNTINKDVWMFATYVQMEYQSKHPLCVSQSLTVLGSTLHSTQHHG